MSRNPAPRLELSLPKVIAGALAAASAAVAASWLGVAGTVFGAVIGSVVATVGTALYAHSLERSQEVIKETIPVLATRAATSRPTADEGLPDPTETLELNLATSTPYRRPVSWSTVAVSCVATLVLGLGVLTGFEAVVGRSASELTGSSSGDGTTLGSLVDGGGSKGVDDGTHHRPGTATTGPTPTSPVTTPRTTEPTTPTATTPTSPTTTVPTSPATTGPTTTEPPTTEPPTTEPTSTGTSAP